MRIGRGGHIQRAGFLVDPRDKPLRVRLEQARYAANGFEHFHMRDERSWRQCLAHYWGLCTLVDRHYGRILDCLRETGQWDDTLIVDSTGEWELCNLHDDPCELTNVVRAVARPAVPALRERLIAWQRRMRDNAMPIPESRG